MGEKTAATMTTAAAVMPMLNLTNRLNLERPRGTTSETSARSARRARDREQRHGEAERRGVAQRPAAVVTRR